MDRKGKLITLEGGEGAGKSTVLEAVRARLAAAGIDALVTREPGGTAAVKRSARCCSIRRGTVACAPRLNCC